MSGYPQQLLSPILDYLRGLEKKLLSRKRHLSSEDPFVDPTHVDDNADPGTEAAEQFGHEQATAMGEETDRALTRVREAMQRITDGTYGKCVKCSKMIDTDRLGIDPTAEYCVECAKAGK